MKPLVLPLGLVLASGFTGLVYQVTWQRYLAIYLGSHAFATALVLAVFFLCMALGYLWIGKRAPRLLRNAFLLYGVLEALIGLWCLASPLIFDGLAALFPAVVEAPLANILYQFAFAVLFIGPPTFLMGGTIPVLTQALTSQFEVSHRTHSLIYGINTVGAFLGTVAAGFFFLEWWGLPGTLLRISFVNLAIGGTAWVVHRYDRGLYAGLRQDLSDDAEESAEARALRLPLLTLSFLSGFYVFGFETLIIRVAGLSLGSTSYTYTIVVASFVLAIALGSFVVGRLRSDVGVGLIVVVQSMMFAGCVFLYLTIPHWPEWLMRVRFLFQPSLINFGPYWATVFALLLLCLLIPIGLLGMNLPLLFHFLKSRQVHLSETVGYVYAVNALGSALGAVVGGYFLFYLFDAPQIFRLNLVLLVLAMPMVLWLEAKATRSWSTLALPVIFLAVVFMLGDWPPERFAPGKFQHTLAPPDLTRLSDFSREAARRDPRLIFSTDGPNASVSVAQTPDGNRILYVNGKPDSVTNLDHMTRAMAPLLALTLAPKIDEVFIAGLGGGLSAGIAASFEGVGDVLVAEISQGVADALPYFDAWNYGLTRERKERYRIVVDDAYKVLLSSPTRFDVVIIEPSNPWVVGVEKLYSLEFYERVRDGLGEDGVLAQWVPLSAMEEKTLLAIFNNLATAFPNVSVWIAASPAALTIVASAKPLVPRLETLRARHGANEKLFRDFGLSSPTTILANQLLSEGAFSRLMESVERLHTLEHPILAYESGRNFFRAYTMPLDPFLRRHLTSPIDPGDPRQQFVYQVLGLDRSAGFLVGGLGFWAARAASSRLHVGRLELTLEALDPGNRFVRASDARVAEYRFLSDPDAARPPARGDEDYVVRMSRMTETYRELVAMQLPAHATRLAELFGNAEARCRQYPEGGRQGRCLRLAAFIDEQAATRSAEPATH